MEKVKLYLKEVYVELTQKTSWPTYKELQKEALIVLIASILFSLLIFGMDALLKFVVDFIY